MKTSKIIISAILILIGVAACTKEGGRQEITFSNGMYASEITRAENTLLNSYFDTGDRIGIFIKENASGTPGTTYTQPLIYTAGANGAMNPPSSQYFPQSGNGISVYAVYPSSAASTAAITTFSINANQTTDTGYKASDLIYCAKQNFTRTSNTIPLVFRHLLSKITITLQAGDGIYTEDLQNAKVDLMNILPSTNFTPVTGAISAATGAVTTVNVKGATTASLQNSVIIIPQTLENNFIRVTLSGGLEMNSIFDTQTVTFGPATAYSYNVTVTKSDISIKSSISAWTNGGTISGNATL
ncbi:MAG: fimbrillin family protein [Bacteroidales bacterium]|nr:fimbrillin family protein [Bacteroidales bacterium]MDD4669768.1 fimbrillin family protein [Bacteroidales bacterium]